jgi:hypothetical protein
MPHDTKTLDEPTSAYGRAGEPDLGALLACEALRLRHRSPRTEKAYVAWIRRFVVFHGKRHRASRRTAHRSSCNGACAALTFTVRPATRPLARRIVHAQVVSDLPDDHLARVEAHPDREADPALALELLHVPPQFLLQVQRRVTGTLRMILVRDRRAEQRHDPVAGVLVDRALEAMNPSERIAKKRSMILCHSSGSTCSARSIFTSAKSTVTCLRSPSKAERDVRIFSAKCFGVYERGSGGGSGFEAVASDFPHSRQNLAFAGNSAPQAAQRRPSCTPHSRQYFAHSGFSAVQP